jgi:hypothetical protein
LEDAFSEFRQTINQPIQEITDATMANIETIARLEGLLDHLVAEFNRIEEEELQSQEMARGQYMINEDGPHNSYHEHVQATTFGSEEVVKETVNEPSLENPLETCLAQFRYDLDLNKLLEQADANLNLKKKKKKKKETTGVYGLYFLFFSFLWAVMLWN